MGARAKIVISTVLIIIVALTVWQLTSPPALPSVGAKYLSPGPYSAQGSWALNEAFSHGTSMLAFSIANTSYPRLGIATSYSLVISVVNQTLTGSYVKGFGLKVTALTIEDNYDGSTMRWNTGSLVDAVQVTSVFFFRTSALHELRFTLTFQFYSLLPLGSLPDKTASASFNITQTGL